MTVPSGSSPMVAAVMRLAIESGPERVLTEVVAAAAELTGAHYAALAIYDGGVIRRFVHRGVSEQTAAALGHPPAGRGLLGELAVASVPVRLADLTADPRFGGFPPGHPPMRSFLGIPVVGGGRRHGNLYLADDEVGLFTGRDEETLATLAVSAAAALDNAERVAAERGRARAEAAARVAAERRVLQEQMLARILDAQEAERARVSRDLHDEIGQALTSVLLGLRLVDRGGHGAATDPQELADRLAEVRELVGDALTAVRRLAFELRPTVLDDLGLAAALRRLCDDVAARAGAPRVGLELNGLDGGARLPAPVETAVYRMVQEALTNVLRHADAHAVTVTASRGPSRLRIRVRDDGTGFDPATRSGSLGLTGMAERAVLVGGTLTIESAPGAGTTVSVEVPDE